LLHRFPLNVTARDWTSRVLKKSFARRIFSGYGANLG
jgi:hypothetical protein